MKKLLTISFLFFLTTVGYSQKFMTQNGKIKFFSKAKLENIQAVNNQVSSVVNMDNGDVAFSMLMKSFVFEKALMQEHFNEKYVESDKFPKATFKGNIKAFEKFKLSAKEQQVEIVGKLTIHGVTQNVTIKGVMHQNEKGQIIAHSVFTINLDDYNVAIPSAVSDNISKTIEITVDMRYEKF